MPKTIYAVIIGINAYPRNKLYGCVNDALSIHDFFSQLVHANPDIEDYQPKLLIAPHPEDADTLDNYCVGPDDYEAPTRTNIIQAFSHFKQAKPEREDICVLYYSGHGSFQGAPPVFWDLKSGKQVETLVCVDSRTPGGRDLVDKESAYLLWDALHDKVSYEEGQPGVHTLLIFDCCHSGDNTRDGSTQVRNRMETPNATETPLAEYQGFAGELSRGDNSEQRYLTALNKWRTQRYVHLAAARESETAKETTLDGMPSGIFTYSLLKTLRNGGLKLSYKELIERLKVMVRNRVDEQIPVLFSTETSDENMTFMGGGLKDPSAEFPVSYNEETASWLMHAGANAGIVPSSSVGTTRVRVSRKGQEGSGIEADVMSVGPGECTLDGEAFSADDQRHEDWVGVISSMAIPVITVGFDSDVSESDRNKLLDAIPKEEDQILYYRFVEEEDEAEYIVYHLKGKYVLAKKGSNVPVFKRNPDPEKFLLGVDRVGRWLRVLEMDNPDTFIDRGAVDIEIGVVEGVKLRLSNLNTVSPKEEMKNPSNVVVNYRKVKGKADEDMQPGLKVRLRTTHTPYYVAALYMDSQYGIASNLESTEITPDGSGEWLKFVNQGKEYRTLPVSLHSNYHKLGITEITDYLKIFVSDKPFPIRGWEQPELKLDDQLIEKGAKEKTRGMDLDEEEGSALDGDWMCITIPIHVRRPLLQQEQPIGKEGKKSVSIGGAKIIAPAGFSAKVSAASDSEIKEMVNQVATRSADQAEDLRKTLLPPPLVWGSTPSSYDVFSRSVSAAAPDSQLSVLELTGVSGDVSTENPLIFEPEEGIEDNEALVSFGYDPNTGLYLPLGFSDDSGQVHIEHLPEATPGQIVGDQSINERSLKGSIKLFFKKVVIGAITGQTNNNVLARCHLNDDGIAVATPLGDGELADPQLDHICLLIHGIIGDTEGQRKAFFEDSDLHKEFDAVISYDYENLNTPIEETAQLLKDDLAKAGIKPEGGKRLTIIAHSMGGLVSRWFIEQLEGSQVVHKLIQLGTPNGGSETSDFRQSVFSMMSLAMNGAVFLKPYLPVLSFIGKKVTKALFKTLDQMSPTKSEFLQKLNAGDNGDIDVPYHVIGGNTSDIKSEDLEGMPLLKQFWEVVKKRGKYELINRLIFKSESPNDIAVTQTSMQTVPTQPQLPFQSVPCDHMSYFVLNSSMGELRELLRK